MKLPIGKSNFRTIIEEDFYFVDKSLLIKEILDDGSEVILITRPRRFGKTLAMSMLQHYFAAQVSGEPTSGLFTKLNIAQMGESYCQHQGKYPVIFLTLKDIKINQYDGCYAGFCTVISKLYREHRYLLASSHLDEDEKSIFLSITSKQASREDIQASLRNLTEYLSRYHGVKPVILLDEYDSPIHAGFTNNYYNEIIELLRGFLGMALKDNPYLYKAVLTGILRVSKESLFSGLNNISVYSILHPKYGAYFGFTESETAQLLANAKMQDQAAEVKRWYNGYQVGEHLLYNPWSILKCVADGGVFEPYWVNTSDDALIRQLLVKSGLLLKEQFEALISGSCVMQLVDENVVFSDLTAQQELGVWSLLLMTGYLTCESFERTDQGKFCQLRIPNREVRNLYRKIIEQWLSDGYSVTWYNEFLGHLLDGDIPSFSYDLQQLMQQTVSFHDMGSEPEAFYHGFFLGLTASLYNHPDYETRSNRESGYGRYDYVIFSRDPNKLTIILEFKRVILPTPKPETEPEILALLQPAAQQALQQIEQLAYLAEIQQRGISNVLKLGLAFSGKHFAISSSSD